MNPEIREQIAALSKGVDESLIRDFFARMDEDYFTSFTTEEIALHLRMSGNLTPDHPIECDIQAATPRNCNIVIAGFDYLSELSIFCGLMAAFGLNIRSGNVYSFGKPVSVSSRVRARIVDFFSVGLRQNATFEAGEQEAFKTELQILVRLLSKGLRDEASKRLNWLLVAGLERLKDAPAGTATISEISFDNTSSPDWTIMEVRSPDEPAFLYSLTSALALREIDIHRVRVGSDAGMVQDQLLFADRRGQKIDDQQMLARLRTAVALVAQFTRFLPSAPDPERAMRHFNQLLDRFAEEGATERMTAFFESQDGMRFMANLLGSSDFLWQDFLRSRFNDLWPLLVDLILFELKDGKESLHSRLRSSLSSARSLEEQRTALNHFKDSQVFLADVKHLADPPDTLFDFSEAVSDLAEVVFEEALNIAQQHLCEKYGEPQLRDGSRSPFSICGLGKFGGREMGYASDVEVLFLYGGPGRTGGPDSIPNAIYFETLVQLIVDLIEAPQKGIFHIDLRLRPYGKAGALASPLESALMYYSANGESAQFERQALIKLRHVAGDEQLSRKIEDQRDRFTYGPEPWDMAAALHLRSRQVRELVRPGKVNVKYSHGGIIDIEYAVQYLQILNGRDHGELRTPNTLQALTGLAALGIITDADYHGLRQAYLFLRSLIDSLRIVRGDASDLVLPEVDSDEFKSLARRLGWGGAPDEAAENLAVEVRRQMMWVESFFVSRFVSPESAIQ
jgi:glutamate-ammonia-ligase adenylyltransferase